MSQGVFNEGGSTTFAPLRSLTIVGKICTVTFYLSWECISVVTAVKPDLVNLSPGASLVSLMTR